MNGVANDLPFEIDLKLTQFPTIALFKADSSNAFSLYAGDQTVADFVKFIKENAVNNAFEIDLAKVEALIKETAQKAASEDKTGGSTADDEEIDEEEVDL